MVIRIAWLLRKFSTQLSLGSQLIMVQSFIHLFIQLLFPEHHVCAGYYSKRQWTKQEFTFWLNSFGVRPEHWYLKKNFFLNVYSSFETERDRAWMGEGQRVRETQNLKQAPGSELSAQSPTRGLNSRTMRSNLGRSWTLNRLNHPGAPEHWYFFKPFRWF